MSWGIWKKIKQGVAKVGGFVRNLLGGAPTAINNAVDTVNSIGKKALKGVKRVSNVVQRFRDSDDDEEPISDDDDDSIPPPKSKSKKVTKRLPKWRKLLERRDVSSDDEVANKYAVSYAGRSWKPKMKYNTRSSGLRHSDIQSSVTDDSEDLTE